MFARARVLSLPLMIVGLAACPTPNGNPTSATPAAPTSSLAATASSPAASTSAAPAPTGTGGDSAESLAAAPCGASEWKHLPAKSFTRNTLVDDACIDIPAGATVAVASGADGLAILTEWQEFAELPLDEQETSYLALSARISGLSAPETSRAC